MAEQTATYILVLACKMQAGLWQSKLLLSLHMRLDPAGAAISASPHGQIYIVSPCLTDRRSKISDIWTSSSIYG